MVEINSAVRTAGASAMELFAMVVVVVAPIVVDIVLCWSSVFVSFYVDVFFLQS